MSDHIRNHKGTCDIEVRTFVREGSDRVMDRQTPQLSAYTKAAREVRHLSVIRSQDSDLAILKVE